MCKLTKPSLVQIMTDRHRAVISANAGVLSTGPWEHMLITIVSKYNNMLTKIEVENTAYKMAVILFRSQYVHTWVWMVSYIFPWKHFVLASLPPVIYSLVTNRKYIAIIFTAVGIWILIEDSNWETKTKFEVNVKTITQHLVYQKNVSYYLFPHSVDSGLAFTESQCSSASVSVSTM